MQQPYAAGSMYSTVEDLLVWPALSQVVLELTERDPIENFTETRQVIAALQGLGVRIAIDDVGTGHSSLQRISEIHADFLKIDISLIKNIHRSLIKQDLVQSLLHVAGAGTGADYRITGAWDLSAADYQIGRAHV